LRPGKHRITLDVPPEFNVRLEALLKVVDADNKSDLIRNALRVYEYITEKTVEGCRFKIVYPDGGWNAFPSWSYLAHLPVLGSLVPRRH
jgi:hypothetical protein